MTRNVHNATCLAQQSPAGSVLVGLATTPSDTCFAQGRSAEFVSLHCHFLVSLPIATSFADLQQRTAVISALRHMSGYLYNHNIISHSLLRGDLDTL